MNTCKIIGLTDHAIVRKFGISKSVPHFSKERMETLTKLYCIVYADGSGLEVLVTGMLAHIICSLLRCSSSLILSNCRAKWTVHTYSWRK